LALLNRDAEERVSAAWWIASIFLPIVQFDLSDRIEVRVG